MKRIFIFLILLILITGCQNSDDSSVNLYHEMIEMLQESNEYSSNSKYYTITYETTNTSDGYRFFIVIDNPQIAMYDVNVIAFEENSDTDNEFAANAGIFDEKINLVPNQVNKDKGFVKGISISGISSSESASVVCLVQWKDNNNSKIYREFLKLSNQ